MERSAHRNPFRVQRTDALCYRSLEESWEDMVERLAAMGWRGAVVGPHGTGKTTLLARLGDELSDRGYGILSIRLSREQRTLDAPTKTALRRAGPTEFVLLDGAEQLGPLRWRSLRWSTRGVGGLIITTHKPTRLPTWIRTGPNPATLVALVGELIERGAAAGEVDDPDTARLSKAEAEQLLQSTGGDMRQALRLLYDRWAMSA